MKISNEIDNKLTELVIDYKCLGAYSDAEELIRYMDNHSYTFSKVCEIMKYNDKSFRDAQEIVLEDIRKEILNIVIDELYQYV